MILAEYTVLVETPILEQNPSCSSPPCEERAIAFLGNKAVKPRFFAKVEASGHSGRGSYTAGGNFEIVG